MTSGQFILNACNFKIKHAFWIFLHSIGGVCSSFFLSSAVFRCLYACLYRFLALSLALFAFCRHCSGRDLHIFQLPTMFNTLHLTLWRARSQFHYNDSNICSLNIYIMLRCVVRARRIDCACTIFCISPNRYLVYISLINYMFSFCALRFMLAIFLIGFCWFSLFLNLSIMRVVCFPSFFCSSSIASAFLSFILFTDRDWFMHALIFQMSDEEEIDAKVFCKWVACVQRAASLSLCFFLRKIKCFV